MRSILGHRWWAALAVLPLAAPAAAEPLLARYEVRAAGVRVMEVEAAFDLGRAGYRVRTRVRLTGPAAVFGAGDQVTTAEGTWRELRPQPRLYRVSGRWRGSPRAVAIDWGADAMPRVSVLDPPLEPDREPIPPAALVGAVDPLAGLAQLLRTVAQTGRCDAGAAVFDGRRRTDYGVRTGGIEALPDGGGPAGEALRCNVESRLVAGARADQDPENARRPVPATVWLARVGPATQPVPVRIELETGWVGTVRILLLGLEATGG